MTRAHLDSDGSRRSPPCSGVTILAASRPVLTASAIGGAGQAPAAAVFTAAQATAGRDAYQARCASCHLPSLAGSNEAAQLAGPAFLNAWRARSTRELYDYIRTSMPPGGATLGADEYLAITAFILQANGAVAGSSALTPTLSVAIGSVATGGRLTAAQAATPGAGAGVGAGGARPAGPPPSRGHYVSGEVPRFTAVTDQHASHAAGRRLADGARATTRPGATARSTRSRPRTSAHCGWRGRGT